jgi:hypothetical protein
MLISHWYSSVKPFLGLLLLITLVSCGLVNPTARSVAASNEKETPSQAVIFRYQPQGLTEHMALYLPTVAQWQAFTPHKIPKGLKIDFTLKIPLLKLAALLPNERGWVIHQTLPKARVLEPSATDPFWREESGQLVFGQQLSLIPNDPPHSPPKATDINPIASVVPGRGIRLYFGWRAHKVMPLMKDVYQGNYSCLVNFVPSTNQQGLIEITDPRMTYAATDREGSLAGPLIHHLEGQYAASIATELNKGVNKALADLLGNQLLVVGGKAMGLVGQRLTWQSAKVDKLDLILVGQWTVKHP